MAMTIDRTLKLDLYKRMLLIRELEEEIAIRYDEQKMRCPTHLSIGQEAVSAAVGLALEFTDQCVSTHRSHGHYLGKGGNPNRMIAELYGKETGCSKGKGGSMHLVDTSVGYMGSTAIVGNTMPVGVGLALSYKIQSQNNVATVFMGEGASEEGVFAESVNFAATQKLPVLFLCENNLYSVYSSLKDRQPSGRSLNKMVEAMGLAVDSGDGNDIEQVYTKTKSAVESIKAGKGPMFLEFATYRWREHCGPNFDNDIGYRSEEEYSAWKKRDPVELYIKQLSEEGVEATELDAIGQDVKNTVSEAFAFAESSPFPNKEEVFTHIYK
jgi:TPP-dependent pyruvate/acetoin dehydrogenase alpha subunit